MLHAKGLVLICTHNSSMMCRYIIACRYYLISVTVANIYYTYIHALDKCPHKDAESMLSYGLCYMLMAIMSVQINMNWIITNIKYNKLFSFWWKQNNIGTYPYFCTHNNVVSHYSRVSEVVVMSIELLW